MEGGPAQEDRDDHSGGNKALPLTGPQKQARRDGDCDHRVVDTAAHGREHRGGDRGECGDQAGGREGDDQSGDKREDPATAASKANRKGVSGNATGDGCGDEPTRRRVDARGQANGRTFEHLEETGEQRCADAADRHRVDGAGTSQAALTHVDAVPTPHHEPCNRESTDRVADSEGDGRRDDARVHVRSLAGARDNATVPPVSAQHGNAASAGPRRLRPSTISESPVAFDSRYELDWSRPEYSRRLLREHLDQSNDGASRRRHVIESQVHRLLQLLPAAPARVLDAACGPGLYALPLARAGYDVTGVDVSPAALRHARAASRALPRRLPVRFVRADLRSLELPGPGFDAAVLIYYVLEAFPRRSQAGILRRLGRALAPGALLVVEMRLRPDQPPGRIDWWEVVPRSILGDRRHLLLGDTTYDPQRNLYVLREMAVFDDGRVEAQQTSAWLCPYDDMPALFRRGGFDVVSIFEGWSRRRATQLSASALVVARRA